MNLSHAAIAIVFCFTVVAAATAVAVSVRPMDSPLPTPTPYVGNYAYASTPCKSDGKTPEGRATFPKQQGVCQGHGTSQ